jgi:hypothetical protein
MFSSLQLLLIQSPPCAIQVNANDKTAGRRRLLLRESDPPWQQRRVPPCGRVIGGQEAAESGFLRGGRYVADVLQRMKR